MAETSQQFLLRPVNAGSQFDVWAKDRFFEVHQVGSGETAIYWLGNPPAPEPVPTTFHGNGTLMRTGKPHVVNELECTAFLKSRGLSRGAVTKLILLLPSDPVYVNLRTHFATLNDPKSNLQFSATFKLIKVIGR